MTIKKLLKRQNDILEKFTEKQRELIIEAIDIEYKLTKVEEGYKLEELD